MNTTIFFPNTVVDLNGCTVNVDELARRYILIFITLKVKIHQFLSLYLYFAQNLS